MEFEVRANAHRRKKALFVEAASAFMAGALTWFVNLDFMAGYFEMEKAAYPLFVGLIALFALLFLCGLYIAARPRIVVKGGNAAVFYPMFRRSRRAALAEITRREVRELRFGAEAQASAAVAAGGIAGYAFGKALSSALDSPDGGVRQYTYYRGGTKLITIRTSDMENAERFDALVRAHGLGDAAALSWPNA